MAHSIIPIVAKDFAATEGLKRYFTGIQCGHGHTAERYVRDGKCAECIRLKNAKNRDVNSEYFRAYRSELYKNKSDEIKQYNSQWRKDNPKRYAEIRRKWKAKNIESVRASDTKYRRKRYANDPEFRCLRSLRVRFLTALKAEKISKKDSYSKSLGYSGAELARHLERQFEKGMTWENHGQWHIDHITPISHLIRQGITDPSAVNCLSNLRPMWASDNISKGAKRTVLL
jgi:hypothetical protein